MQSYKVNKEDVKDFLKAKSYNCTDYNLSEYAFDMTPVYLEYIGCYGDFDYLQAKISAFEFQMIHRETNYGGDHFYEDTFSKQWQDFLLERHKEEYLPHLTKWVDEKINSLIQEREDKKAIVDKEKRKIDSSYELEISYYKNYKNSLNAKNEQRSF